MRFNDDDNSETNSFAQIKILLSFTKMGKLLSKSIVSKTELDSVFVMYSLVDLHGTVRCYGQEKTMSRRHSGL